MARTSSRRPRTSRTSARPSSTRRNATRKKAKGGRYETFIVWDGGNPAGYGRTAGGALALARKVYRDVAGIPLPVDARATRVVFDSENDSHRSQMFGLGTFGWMAKHHAKRIA